jgi:hypothetical protein
MDGVVVITPDLAHFVQFDINGRPSLSPQRKPFAMLLNIFLGRYLGLEPSVFADYSYIFLEGELIPHPWVMMYKKWPWWDRWTGKVKRNEKAEGVAKRLHFTGIGEGIYGDVVLSGANWFMTWNEAQDFCT